MRRPRSFELIDAERTRRLPVGQGGRLVVIITEGDLRRWVVQVAEE